MPLSHTGAPAGFPQLEREETLAPDMTPEGSPGVPPSLVSRAHIGNASRIFAAKMVRSFCYGFLGILLPLHLSQLGLPASGVGTAVTLTLVASAVLTAAARRPAERFGAPRVLVVLAGLSLVSALLLGSTRTPWVVIAAAMLSNVAVGAGETGPFLALEQVVVTRVVRRDRLNMALSLYNLAGYVAAAAGAATAALLPIGVLFAVFGAGAALQVIAYWGLRGAGLPASRPRADLASLPSASIIRRLALLFAIDSFAGGFVLQSLIAYWLHLRYGFTIEALGPIFFLAQLLSALSFLAAARLADRLGLINTMVFTHLFSNLVLIAMAVAPSAWIAVALLLLRQLFSQMDVPTRQAYVMSVVEDYEREAAASLTNLSRTIAQAVSPTLTGYAIQGLALSTPFVVGGALKILYDLLLYATFRRIPPRV
jgi:MFS family permease